MDPKIYGKNKPKKMRAKKDVKSPVFFTFLAKLGNTTSAKVSQPKISTRLSVAPSPQRQEKRV